MRRFTRLLHFPRKHALYRLFATSSKLPSLRTSTRKLRSGFNDTYRDQAMKQAATMAEAQAPMSDHEYHRFADAHLDLLANGMADMVTATSGMTVQRNAENGWLSIEMGPNKGSFIVSKEVDSRKLVLFTPSAGTHKYIFDQTEERWVSDSDGHVMLELLTRELLKVGRGMPNF